MLSREDCKNSEITVGQVRKGRKSNEGLTAWAINLKIQKL